MLFKKPTNLKTNQKILLLVSEMNSKLINICSISLEGNIPVIERNFYEKIYSDELMIVYTAMEDYVYKTINNKKGETTKINLFSQLNQAEKTFKLQSCLLENSYELCGIDKKHKRRGYLVKKEVTLIPFIKVKHKIRIAGFNEDVKKLENNLKKLILRVLENNNIFSLKVQYETINNYFFLNENKFDDFFSISELEQKIKR